MDIIWGVQSGGHAIPWNWIIAVYLFLAGVSGGAFLTSSLTELFGKKSESSQKIVRTGAFISPIAIILGLALLVFDLSKPLSFWKLLIYVNWGSVMSIGVFIISAFSALTVVYGLLIWLEAQAEKQAFLSGAGEKASPVKHSQELAAASATNPSGRKNAIKFIAALGSLLALGTATYTGFLLSDVTTNSLWSLPLLTSSSIPFLPILFLISASSAGLATTLIGARGVTDITAYKKIDLVLILLEILLLIIFYASVDPIYFSGSMAGIFWFGIMGVGLVIPLVLTLYGMMKHKNWVLPICSAVIVGGFCLRYFIVYAGQLF